MTTFETTIDQVRDVLKSTGIEFQCDHKIGDHTVTFYVESKKTAIDVVPDIKFANKRQQQSKTFDLRDNHDVRLISVYNHEWINKRDKLTDLITGALGKYEKRIYARTCVIADIDSKTYRSFLEENHLQGAINASSICQGLYTGDMSTLVAVIGFGPNRFKKDEFELHRYCVHRRWQVTGAFSKMIEHCGIKHFISYIDIAHFTGNGYKAIGFEQTDISYPSYVYVKDGVVLSRISCQKHKLSKRFKDFDPNDTETQTMEKHGWTQVFDCGCLKMTYGGTEEQVDEKNDSEAIKSQPKCADKN